MYYNRMKVIDVKSKTEFTVWQKVEADEDNGNGQVVGYVDATGAKVKLPKVYEMSVEESELERPE